MGVEFKKSYYAKHGPHFYSVESSLISCIMLWFKYVVVDDREDDLGQLPITVHPCFFCIYIIHCR